MTPISGTTQETGLSCVLEMAHIEARMGATRGARWLWGPGDKGVAMPARTVDVFDDLGIFVESYAIELAESAAQPTDREYEHEALRMAQKTEWYRQNSSPGSKRS